MPLSRRRLSFPCPLRFALRGLLAAGLLAAAGLAPPRAAWADVPEVLAIEVTAAGEEGDERFYTFSVTIRHNDEGWKHYVTSFEVLDAASGKLLGERILLHPHVEEQPFTREFYRLPVSKEVKRVIIRAHDKMQHGYSEPVEADLPQGEEKTVRVGDPG